MVFQIRIANMIVQIRSVYDLLYRYCKKYLVPSTVFCIPDIEIDITEDEIARELYAYQSSPSGIKVNSTTLQSQDYLEINLAYRKIVEAMLPLGRLLMHGSIVSTDGYGYMFAAPSGVGKTTRTRLWIENIQGSIVVNGDKPLLEITDNKVIAYGTPWSGKEWWNNDVSVPLQAIMIVERAAFPGECVIEELMFKDAYPFMLQQVYVPHDQIAMKTTLRMLNYMQGMVSFYRFRSEPTPEAISIAYEKVRHK